MPRAIEGASLEVRMRKPGSHFLMRACGSWIGPPCKPCHLPREGGSEMGEGEGGEAQEQLCELPLPCPEWSGAR